MSKDNSAKSVEKEGGRPRVSLRSTTVHAGGGQLSPTGARRRNRGVMANCPITHPTRGRPRTLLPGTMMAGARGREHDGGSLRLCGRTAPRALLGAPQAPRGALPRASRRPRPWASRRRRGRVLLPNPGRAGGPPACRPPGPLPARPSAAATHSHRGRHRVAQVFAHRLGETILARVQEAGQGQREGSAGKTKQLC